MRDPDRHFIDWLVEGFEREHNVDLRADDMALMRLKRAAEKARRELSSASETEINIPFIANSSDQRPLHLQRTIDRRTLAELTREGARGEVPFSQMSAAEESRRDKEEERAPAPLTLVVDQPPVRTSANYRDVVTTPGRFEATFGWRGPVTYFMTFFALCWNAFLVVWYAIAMSSGDIAAMIFPILHLVAGFAMTWSVLAGWLNKTTVKIEDGVLSCTHGPIPKPFGNAESVDLESVKSFRVERRDKGSQGENKHYKWFIIAKHRSGEDITVTDGLGSQAAAEYLERKLERHRMDSDEALREFEETEEGAPVIQDQAALGLDETFQKIKRDVMGSPSEVRVSSDELEEEAELEEVRAKERGGSLG